VECNEWNSYRLTAELRSEQVRGGSPESFPGSTLLTGAGPREILQAISLHDPLAMQRRCLHHLRRRALLVAPGRLTVRSLAHTAYAARRYRGDPPLDDWLRERIDAALEGLLRDDMEEEHAGHAGSGGWDRRFACIADALEVEPELGRVAAVTFNELPHAARAAYLAIVIGGVSLRRHVAAGHGPPAHVRSDLARVERALARLRRAAGSV